MNLHPGVQAFERAARIACNKLNENPDEMTSVPHPQLAGVTHQVPRWAHVAEQMFNLSILMVAMREAAMTDLAVGALLRAQH